MIIGNKSERSWVGGGKVKQGSGNDDGSTLSSEQVNAPDVLVLLVWMNHNLESLLGSSVGAVQRMWVA